jgi:hypothetical protein
MLQAKGLVTDEVPAAAVTGEVAAVAEETPEAEVKAPAKKAKAKKE